MTDVPDPSPRHGELLVRVGTCGICGTDVHIADGEFPSTPYPIIAGHEFAGRVAARGEGVPGDWREGQRVAVDPSLFCGYCPACRAGRGNLCASWNAIGDTVDGAFAEYVAVPATNAYRIPDSVNDSQGALIEPLPSPLQTGGNGLGLRLASRARMTRSLIERRYSVAS